MKKIEKLRRQFPELTEEQLKKVAALKKGKGLYETKEWVYAYLKFGYYVRVRNIPRPERPVQRDIPKLKPFYLGSRKFPTLREVKAFIRERHGCLTDINVVEKYGRLWWKIRIPKTKDDWIDYHYDTEKQDE